MNRRRSAEPSAAPVGVSRRRMVLGASLVILLATACTQEGPPSLPENDASGAITLAVPPDVSLGAQREWAVDCFETVTGQQVNHITLPTAADDQHAQLMSELQADNPGYDVLGLDVMWTPEFAKAGLIVPLDEIADALAEDGDPTPTIDVDRYFGSVRESLRYDGRYWAVPLHSNAGLLYYNTEYIAPEEVPATWEDLADWLRRHRPDGVEGYVGQFAPYEGLTVNASTLAWAFGEGFVSEDGEVVADTPGTREGLRFLAKGFSEGWIPERVLDWREQESLDAFRNGDAVFMHQWPTAYAQLKDPNSPVRDTFGVTQLPGTSARPAGPNTLGGANLAISRHSRRPRAAYDLIRFLTSEPVQRRVAARGGYPTAIESVYEETEESADDLEAALGEEIDSRCAQEELSPPLEDRRVPQEVLRDALANARSRPATPYYERVTALIHGTVHEWLEDAVRQPPPDGEEADGEALIGQQQFEDFADELREAIEDQ